MSYEDSYVKAFPFDKMVEGMMNPEMIDDTIQIIMEGIRRRKRMNLIINDRAGGNGPIIAQQIAKRLRGLKLRRGNSGSSIKVRIVNKEMNKEKL
jgi:hypothetical protein